MGTMANTQISIHQVKEGLKAFLFYYVVDK